MLTDNIIQLLVLSAASFFTSFISGVVGMAGGALLLGIMTLSLPIFMVIPIHGVVQLVSNLSRTIFLKENVDKSIIGYFLVGAPIGAMLGYFLVSRIAAPEWILLFISFLLLYVAFKPKKMPSIKLPLWGFSVLGMITCMLSLLIGATGPLLAPFLARDDFPKEKIVATKAGCQLITHVIKIPVFLMLSFNYQAHIILIACMCFAVLLGTRLGTLALKNMSQHYFWILLKICCTLLSIKLGYEFWTH